MLQSCIIWIVWEFEMHIIPFKPHAHCTQTYETYTRFVGVCLYLINNNCDNNTNRIHICIPNHAIPCYLILFPLRIVNSQAQAQAQAQSQVLLNYERRNFHDLHLFGWVEDFCMVYAICSCQQRFRNLIRLYFVKIKCHFENCNTALWAVQPIAQCVCACVRAMGLLRLASFQKSNAKQTNSYIYFKWQKSFHLLYVVKKFINCETEILF